ncbi:hypothetical protein GIB67_011943 [Kingdonia uniflora]|uniref:Uncharacterized protein n=1 Tax=Kingdonia uniflora TaxID=39325 RepID=A0A7J7M058_9MAGN|nr:hypothetical protein GIB67_011943 [Kingdonia uniflora]
MGRSPCCEKVGLKKGPWTPEEDQKLLAYVEEHGHGSWRALPARAGLQRCGKSCRLRWTNYLRPDIKRGKFSLQEEQTIIQLHALLGNRWSAIATHLPKRTDNEIKNYWNTHLKKRLLKMGIDPLTHKPKNDTLSLGSGQSNSGANLSHMAQWESARLEAEARLVRESKMRANSLHYQHGLPGTGLSSGSSLTTTTEPICLDVLKAWQGAWSKSMKSSGQDLESPTSTLSFLSDNSLLIPNSMATIDCGGLIVKEEGEEDIGHFNLGPNEMVFESPLASELPKPEDEDIPVTNFTDGFTNLLLENSDSSDGSRDSDGTCSEYENKNYWNEILNLVNCSPSGSPVF